jgi:hypothetical protein
MTDQEEWSDQVHGCWGESDAGLRRGGVRGDGSVRVSQLGTGVRVRDCGWHLWNLDGVVRYKGETTVVLVVMGHERSLGAVGHDFTAE